MNNKILIFLVILSFSLCISSKEITTPTDDQLINFIKKECKNNILAEENFKSRIECNNMAYVCKNHVFQICEGKGYDGLILFIYDKNKKSYVYRTPKGEKINKTILDLLAEIDIDNSDPFEK